MGLLFTGKDGKRTLSLSLSAMTTSAITSSGDVST